MHHSSGQDSNQHTPGQHKAGCQSDSLCQCHLSNQSKAHDHQGVSGSCCSTSGKASSCCSSDNASQKENQCCSSDDEDASDRTSVTQGNGKQTYIWRVSGMDCASCARSIEKAVTSVDGVVSANVVFSTEKLRVSADADVSVKVQEAVKGLGFSLASLDKSASNNTNSAQTISNQNTTSWFSRQQLSEYGPIAALAVLMLLSWGIAQFNPLFGETAFIVTTLVGLVPIMKKSWRMMRSGSPFAIETLMSVAAIGALFIGATAEAAMVLLLFMIGECLESFAANRARKGVSALMALLPEEALIIKNGVRQKIAIADLRPGDEIEVSPGERLPADAELLSEMASFDESALTGESVPVERLRDEKVPAGSLLADRVVRLKVVSQPGNNAIDRILHLIEEAEERRAPLERFLDKFSRIYTPVIMLISVLVILIPPLAFAQPWDTWIYRGLALLLIGCPCALVISTPAAITSGLAAATRRGALIKGGLALEQLGRIKTIALDKTGTLTEGKPSVTDVVTLNGSNFNDLLAAAASVEMGSHHPLAKAIVDYTEQQGIALVHADNRKTLAGVGVEGDFAGRKIKISSPSKLEEALDDSIQQEVIRLEQEGKTVVVVLEKGELSGLIALRDRLRDDAKAALKDLAALGINGVMLTGDNARAAAAIAAELNIDYRADLLPEDKVMAVTELNQQQATAMVGDGINDAPAMKASTIGIAMGSGTDVALETADAALTHNRLQGLAEMIRLSRATNANIRQNITIALGLKAVFLVTTLLGITGLWLAVLADSGATALVTANALRLLRKKESAKNSQK
ncbi:zinc/cadmium/mercury/lead-transporting ATPase [Marinomonas sp. UCMA 3892]|uniref:zinc/cadmium/mercury/lead-transporting ATPase n=1 Tax=unclassified Marinomonas TaxID=196814 RepID=UPI00146E9BE5|nr:zinc/cadmium/mercury/lead-transporting ATPase [Marinomonas sp. UCMA 3892]NLV00673.1 zinc/cadmium/mercury/lead-transporting ATPase [Marinomonas sp. UCMA 3892]